MIGSKKMKEKEQEKEQLNLKAKIKKYHDNSEKMLDAFEDIIVVCKEQNNKMISTIIGNCLSSLDFDLD